tara:strand:+ start:173 stop:454 length:282 start_codon:yes stop_codon:yes gene_type:complete
MTIINIIDLEEDLVTHESIHYIVTALVEDKRLARPAVYHPADLASPEEHSPGVCSAGFEVLFGDDPPPTLGSPLDLLSYIQDLDLDWQLDEDD